MNELIITKRKHSVLGCWYEFVIKEKDTGKTLLHDSIDDTGQGDTVAITQIKQILRNMGVIK